MTELNTKYSGASLLRRSGCEGRISRRAFCQSGLIAGGTAILAVFSRAGSPCHGAQGKNRVKFYKNLACGHIGVKTDQRQAVSPL